MFVLFAFSFFCVYSNIDNREVYTGTKGRIRSEPHSKIKALGWGSAVKAILDLLLFSAGFEVLMYLGKKTNLQWLS